MYNANAVENNIAIYLNFVYSHDLNHSFFAKKTKDRMYCPTSMINANPGNDHFSLLRVCYLLHCRSLACLMYKHLYLISKCRF